MSYMESECMCLSTFRSCYYVNNIYVHSTCTIHLCENYNHYLILSITVCSLKVIRFPLLKFENVIKIISRLKLPKK